MSRDMITLETFCAVDRAEGPFSTERCAPFDNDMCDGTGTVWDSQFPIACRELAWCDYLCGKECEKGVGGLCFLSKISNLQETCSEVSKRVVAVQGDPSLYDKSHSLAPNHDDSFLEHMLHPGGHDGGCGAHALCSTCSGDCLRGDVHSYFFELFGEVVDTPAIAPPANVKYALANAVGTCAQFSLLSNEAEALRTKVPASSSGGSSSSNAEQHESFAKLALNAVVVVAVLVLMAFASAIAVKFLRKRRQHSGAPSAPEKWLSSANAETPFQYLSHISPLSRSHNIKDPAAGLDTWRAQNPAAESHKALLRHTHVYGAFTNQRGANNSDDEDAASECGSDVVVL